MAGLTGAFITSLYTFRMVFLIFYGEEKAKVSEKHSVYLKVPLVILATLSLLSGFVEMPQTLGGLSLFTDFMRTALPAPTLTASGSTELTLEVIASLVSLAGVWAAYLLFLRQRAFTKAVSVSTAGKILSRFWAAGWGFDWLYDKVIVQPFLWMARINRDDFIDLIYGGTAWYSEQTNRFLSFTQSGNVRWYAAVLAFGAVLLIALVVFV